MKTRTLFLFALTLTAGAISAASPAKPQRAVVIDADTAAITETFRTHGDVRLTLGATRDEVLYSLGQPTFKTSPNGWLYENISPVASARPGDPYVALSVVFDDHGVLAYRLINKRVVIVLHDETMLRSKNIARRDTPVQPASVVATTSKP